MDLGRSESDGSHEEMKHRNFVLYCSCMESRTSKAGDMVVSSLLSTLTLEVNDVSVSLA